MTQKKLVVVVVLLFSQILGLSHSQAASTYKLEVVVVELEAVKQIARFNGATVKEVCGQKKVTFLNKSFTGQDAKVTSFTRIRVKNESGKIIGTGSLSKILWAEDYASGNLIQGTCLFTTIITVKAAEYYTVELVGLDSYDFSLADLKKTKWKAFVNF
jgi:hypothetical protein